METIFTKQLLAFLETNNLLSDHQYMLRQARSTWDILVYAVHAWSSALESYGESRVISLDVSKAFDRVWHKGFHAKLPMFGLHHTLITWISSFLSDRSIAIRVDGYLSKPHSIDSGVPQGSVISPVLFILFLNDLLPMHLLAFSLLLMTLVSVQLFHPIQNTLPILIFHHIVTLQPHFSPLT